MRVWRSGEAMRNRRMWVFALLFSLMILQMPAGESYPYGIEDVENGCICHNLEPTGTVIISLEGMPEQYEENKTYTLNISAENGAESIENYTNYGGFNLWISHGILTNISEEVQVFSENEVGHSEAGNDQRNWVVNWTAPEGDSIRIEYRLHINTVNGDGSASPDDQWNVLSGTINGEPQEPVSKLFLYGVPIVLISIAGLVYYREMRKLRIAAAEEE